MPIRVIPICTADRNRPGSAARSSAVWAPRRPAFAIAFSRGFREETIASSDMAKTPFKVTSNKMMTTSNQGKGVRGGDIVRAFIEGRPLDLKALMREAPVVPDQMDAMNTLSVLRGADVPMA